ncbi:hypothetical protein UFOVP1157_42 [uncultured Caudovirales phage]|uniref:HNHc domain containing protein n=1 Tax=uncultured Caudovirales phage TaxID=2100421 RepID=A0A6J5MNF9_9CAUD|nr:hypothetical protein UFOVP497_53 [uncultured Caudovirales phage]CAB4164427.1 hypothetical protein UFOVP834_29 [uncultured Caudovirales phage]CAB4172385.1 hypothetical protein UFOVP922_42 [uncultured Caudovirales phage]CAB4177697.1 hypothetical protein UFOVP1006_35 [uncultured Caudovirales phage]CAB4184152.1 hypothetical protein UFOVP1096_45 [uncultured Caudovirales phage]
MSAPRNSAKDRRTCIDTHAWFNLLGRKCLTCHVCNCTIDLIATKPSDWRADHIQRHAEGGKGTGDNLWPICIDCDTGPDGKAAQDTKTIAHGKRMADRHDGVKIRGRGFR